MEAVIGLYLYVSTWGKIGASTMSTELLYCVRMAKRARSNGWFLQVKEVNRLTSLPRMNPRTVPQHTVGWAACLSNEGRRIDKFMSAPIPASPCMPRLRLRLAPPAQAHDSAPTGSSAMPHRSWEPPSRDRKSVV